MGNGVYYLSFANGDFFGYYAYLSDPHYIYHFDLGYEYVIDAQDSAHGIYLYDFASKSYWYSSPGFPFPYLYDFSLKAYLYYYPDVPADGRYTHNPRYFYDLTHNAIITK